jgi:hypothetical protein
MSEPMKMDTQKFADALDRWGSDLATWPAPQSSAGRELLATSEVAQALLAQANSLDQLLNEVAGHKAPLGLERKILNQIASQDSMQEVVDWFSATLWRPALAATCALLLGFSIGIALPQSDNDLMLDNVSMLAFSAGYEELEDEQP